MPDMNPYNFVRLRPMADGARQVPLSHGVYVARAGEEAVYSGRLTCTLTAFSPIMILSYNEAQGDFSVDRSEHKHFHRFFHYPDSERPVIPGTALKGMLRSVAEAASNSCMAILDDEHKLYEKRWPDFKYSYPDSLTFCGRVHPGEGIGGSGPKAFCPTCRIFGTAPEGADAGTAETGAYPHAYRGKVQISDALFVGDYSNASLPMDRPLITLLEPKVSEKVWYRDPGRNVEGYTLAGRKFYYHHDELKPQTEDRPNKFNATVTPLRAGATFEFDIDFTNLLQSELALLLYSLELEPARQLIVSEGDQLRFNWRAVSHHSGIYHKLGYGKAAGLGSCAILVSELSVFQATNRYGGNGDDWTRLTLAETRENVTVLKREFYQSQEMRAGNRRGLRPYFADLRKILRFPNNMGTLRYPTLAEFGDYKEGGRKLPSPGQEQEWITR